MQQAEINLLVALAGLIIAITPALVAVVYAQSKRLDSQGAKISGLQDGGVEAKIDAKLREYSLIRPTQEAVPAPVPVPISLPITKPAPPDPAPAPPISDPAPPLVHADTLPITEGKDE